MTAVLPLRLLGRKNEDFFVFDPRSPEHMVDHFDIISYTWGDTVPPYHCGIENVSWEVILHKQKLEDIKNLMIRADIQNLWVDCVCINQTDDKEKNAEVVKMYEYYRSARSCYILVEMDDVWDPQKIVNDLRFLGHILSNMGGTTLASEAKSLTTNLTNQLSEWAKKPWTFGVHPSIVQSAAIDMGVLNCYSTCIHHVRSLFENPYFTRMWTFQEMILGKNITMWGISPRDISCIGELHIWMDLATDAKDKAYKLQEWVENCWHVKPDSVNTILRFIEDDNQTLSSLQLQVKGISSARTDIINGGPYWWYENYMGVSNIFSAVSITPRKARDRVDIFKGLLGVFSGLFTAEEVNRDMSHHDIDRISFAFFKQLSIKTGRAWTKLAISSGDRGDWDWIPVAEIPREALTTDCFAGVVNLGSLKKGKHQARALAMTGIKGVPRKYMKIELMQDNRGYQFIFKGCNCGKKQKTGKFKSELIPTDDQPREVVMDETGRILVQCATILGSLMDPGRNLVQYRKRFLNKLQPYWDISDPNAKPAGWINRCVSGTVWENPFPEYFRAHNMSMNYKMVSMVGCGSRLENENTESISCEVRINCGCVIVAPFSWIFEAITAVQDSFLGDIYATLDNDNRIVLKDGVGLVQVGDVGRAFNLVAFGGEVNSHKTYASNCRSTRLDKPIFPQVTWPTGRALVRAEFTHDIMDMMRDYSYVETGGSGNLLICRSHPMDQYKIIGVCIDEGIVCNKGRHTVSLR
ncbi:Fc.00g114650.m01.CDS01 [Cosmosporella sp. VM-42]